MDVHNGSRMLDQFKGRFYLNQTFCGQTDLMGYSVGHEDAGTYSCVHDGDYMYSAELIVLSKLNKSFLEFPYNWLINDLIVKQKIVYKIAYAIGGWSFKRH